MSTDPGVWGWTSDIGHRGFTVTFSLGRSPEEVVGFYGADVSKAQLLTRQDAWLDYPPNHGGAQLRAGTLGRWGFCFEEAGIEGTKSRALGRLSMDTEAISFFSSPTRSSFTYLSDGQIIESFEPDLPTSVRGHEPCRFWDSTQKILERARDGEPMPTTHAVLQMIAKYLREPLDRAALEGPLLTAFLPDLDRAPSDSLFDGIDSIPQVPAWSSGSYLDSPDLPSSARAYNPGYGDTDPVARAS